MRPRAAPLVLIMLFFVSSLVMTMQTPTLNAMASVETTTIPHVIAQDSDVHTIVIPSSNDEAVSSFNPNTNYHSNVYKGGLFVGRDVFGSYYTSRSWLMFNLTHLPQDLDFINASLNVYCNGSISSSDYSIGAHFSSDDSWREETITWNNQPSFSSFPEDSIDTPASPDMFIDNHWYSWNVTTVFGDSLAGDNVLSLVLKQYLEAIAATTWKYFTERNCSEYYAPYISIYYRTPTTSSLSVDGFSSPPDTDLIYSANPEFGWQFDDATDHQRSYEIVVADSDDEVVWSRDMGSVDEVFTSGADEVSEPFVEGNGVRMQMSWGTNLVGKSGIVDRIYLGTSAPSGTTITLHNFTVLMKHTYQYVLDSVFKNNYQGEYPTTVLFRDHLELTARDGYFAIDVENTFAAVNYHYLVIELRYSNQSEASVSLLAENAEGNGYVALSTGAAGSGAEMSEIASSTYVRTCNLKLGLLSNMVLDAGSSGSQYPFDYHSARLQLLYNSSFVGRAGYIDRLYFESNYRTSTRPSMTFENFTVVLAEPQTYGPLDLTFSFNYIACIPQEVLFRNEITIHNTGYWFEIALDTPFYYNHTGSLLVELLWDARTSSKYVPPIFNNAGPGYRAIAQDSSAAMAVASDTTIYSLAVGFLDSEEVSTYDGAPLPSGEYSLQVRTSDSLGMWSPWAELDFKYLLAGDGPRWSNLVYSNDPAEVNQSLTVEIDADGILGVSTVMIESDGVNHSMTLATAGNTYWYTWIPEVLGAVDYTIYLRDGLGHWNTATGSVFVHDTVSPSIMTHPSDMEYILGSLGNRLEWSVEEHLPGNYFIYVDGILERSGPWDGSTIGFTVDGLGVGVHTVTMRVVDTSGNEDADTVLITVSESSTTTPTTSTTPPTSTITSTQPGTGGSGLTNLLLLAVGALGVLNLLLLIVVLKKKPSG